MATRWRPFGNEELGDIPRKAREAVERTLGIKSAAVTGAVVAAAGVANSAYQGHEARKDARAANQRNAWVGEAQKDLVSRATEIADRPYTPYTGNRVADLSQNESTAINMAKDATTFNDARGYLDKAGAQADLVAGSEWNEDTAKKYMDPYIGQVVDNSLKRENTAYQQSQNQIRGNAARSGAFGGSRATLLETQGTGEHLQTVGDITSKGYSDAYRSAIGTWQADNNRRLAASQAYTNVGGDISKLNSSQITDLLRTGQADRVLRQAQADVDYEQFIENRDWEVNNLEPLFKAVGGSNGGAAQQTVQRDNTAGQLIGLASTLVGYFGANQSGGSGLSSMWSSDQIQNQAMAGNQASLDAYTNSMAMPTIEG